LIDDLDDRDTVGVERFVGLFFIPVGDAIEKQQSIVGVLIVLHEQTMRRSLDWEVHQAVIVHAPLLRLVGRAVAAILLELRAVGDRIAPSH
jgi:hypothetical protein